MVQAGDGGSFVHRHREVLRCIRQGAVTGGDRKRERTARAGSWGAAERGRTGPVVNEGNAARETPTRRQGGVGVARSCHSERACRAGSWGAAERGRTGPVVNEGNAARE